MPTDSDGALTPLHLSESGEAFCYSVLAVDGKEARIAITADHRQWRLTDMVISNPFSVGMRQMEIVTHFFACFHPLLTRVSQVPCFQSGTTTPRISLNRREIHARKVLDWVVDFSSPCQVTVITKIPWKEGGISLSNAPAGCSAMEGDSSPRATPPC